MTDAGAPNPCSAATAGPGAASAGGFASPRMLFWGLNKNKCIGESPPMIEDTLGDSPAAA